MDVASGGGDPVNKVRLSSRTRWCRCTSYAKAKNCKAQWDRRTKECVCVGLNGVINTSLRRNKTELRFADEQQADCNHSAIMF
jgi:hypothetical protein